jgi:hypothetical protein
MTIMGLRFPSVSGLRVHKKLRACSIRFQISYSLIPKLSSLLVISVQYTVVERVLPPYSSIKI